MEKGIFNYRRSLKEALRQRKAQNALYSMRSLARDLGISVTALSQVLSNKRDFSKKNIKKVAEKLCWSPLQLEQAMNSIKREIDPTQISKDIEFLEMEDHLFSLISEWHYFAILNLAALPKCSNQPEVLSTQLGISKASIETALEKLQGLDLIKIHKKYIVRTKDPLRTTLEIPSLAIKKYHKENLNLVRHAIDHVPLELREINAMTLNIDTEKMGKAKKMIVSFLKKFTKEMEKTKPKKTYTLSVQFVPTTMAIPSHKEEEYEN